MNASERRGANPFQLGKILILEMSIARDVNEVEKCKVRFSSAREVARKNFPWPMLIESGSRTF